jgi:hypothetical protein
MLKKIIFLFFLPLFLLLTFQNCADLTVSPEDRPSRDTTVEKIIDRQTGGNLYGDTIIGTRIVVDTSEAVTWTDVILSVNLNRSINGGLGRTAADRVKLRDYRIDSINAITLQFMSIGGSDTLSYSFPIVNHVCSVTSVKVPTGKIFQVLVGLWHIKKCPYLWWGNYSIYDRSFNSLDTVNLATKAKDTINLLFAESQRMKYFFELKINGRVGVWTENKNYQAYDGPAATPTIYKGGSLFGYYAMADLESASSCVLHLDCDTGRVLMSFLPNVMSMIPNNGVVVVAADSVFAGIHTTKDDSLTWLILDPPIHNR